MLRLTLVLLTNLLDIFRMQQLENIAESEFGKPEEVLTRRLQVNRYTRSAVLNIPAVLVRKCRLSDKDLMKFNLIEDENNTRLVVSKAKVS
jgi:hypothetical protein